MLFEIFTQTGIFLKVTHGNKGKVFVRTLSTLTERPAFQGKTISDTV